MTKLLVSYGSIFVAIFLAELADKTQIASFTLAASGSYSRLGVFLAASLALVVSTGLVVFLSDLIAPALARFPVERISGAIFLAIGGWMLLRPG